MTQTIEQLTARVRELEADRDQWMSDCKTFHREMEKREQQILSLQAYAEQLRKWVIDSCMHADTCYCLSLDDEGKHMVCSCGLTAALAIPHDTSTLDAYVAKKVKEATEKLHYRMEHCYSIDGMKAILDLDEMTRQRDLAVEALEDATTSLETIHLRSYGEESYLDSRPLMRSYAGARAKVSREALSAIKESEAK